MVSIVIPLYNRLGLIEHTIQSVMDQTYVDWELLVVDDHSDDGGFDKVIELSKAETRIKAIKRDRQPKGASTCRNIGMQNASGRYLMFLDSDDLLVPSCIEERVAKIESHASVDFIVNQVGIVDSHGTLTSLWSTLDHDDDIGAFVQFLGWSVASTLFRMSFVNQYTWDEDAMSWQDWDFHLQMLFDSPKYLKYADSEPDVHIRRAHEGRITAGNISEERQKSRFDLLLKLESKLNESGRSNFISHLLMHYFRLLEQASIFLSTQEFSRLHSHWQHSKTFETPLLKKMNRYWKIHQFGRKTGLKIVHSLNYRVSRYILPDQLVGKKPREVTLT